MLPSDSGARRPIAGQAPLLLAPAMAYGVDPIHFGIIMVLAIVTFVPQTTLFLVD